ncbi:type IV secretion system protein VirB9 [Rhizobium leguminosarum]|uniref:TrbG/VirB9 family P-type conjugative transfer protein n=1 Tax=Rhizobium TaxID=379 RepID=UPI0010308207|nr:TrbG/VirB9 family P-type conjugative transfer protein [Rhizobium leguminosarum]TBF87511.1 type IV secretion system protein VirB9 [Rhizobium leguminosarum]TBG06987.1 type IV secretion system protein VirB9 [Rhizobium leguminosarum]TBG07858.1 type IV secretion system protein VirB9 [Rhizobium leguminosarum]TBG30024.1 type IV secretion system protein VirB9 [Rhizobium leguminosarum]TBG50157.1 type IV secretion system protein VirB9 [Rhizobium leguminosarum]
MITRYVFVAAIILGVSGHSHAEQRPVAGGHDPRMRYINYDPEQVVNLSSAVGATLVVTFAQGETVTAVAVSNSNDLAAMPRENYLFLKSKEPLPPQPVVVLTAGPQGLRRYVFSIVTTPMDSLDVGQSNLYYSVQFKYPADEAAARFRAQQEQAAERRARGDQMAARRALDALGRPDTSPALNWRYMAQGDRSLAPVAVYDNGRTTFFRFPGRSRLPAIFSIGADGEETSVNFSLKGDILEIASVERGWRLRDGNTVLCVWNSSFDAIGVATPTGTISANVERVVKETPHE